MYGRRLVIFRLFFCVILRWRGFLPESISRWRTATASDVFSMIDMMSAESCRCCRIPMASQARISNDLVPMSVESGARAIRAAISSTVASSASAATTRLTKPMVQASPAVRVWAV